MYVFPVKTGMVVLLLLCTTVMIILQVYKSSEILVTMCLCPLCTLKLSSDFEKLCVINCVLVCKICVCGDALAGF